MQFVLCVANAVDLDVTTDFSLRLDGISIVVGL